MRPPKSELTYWLALLRAPGIGPRSYQKLLDHYHQPSEVFGQALGDEAGPHLPEATRQWLANPDWSVVEQDLAWLRQRDAHAITWDDARYPRQLREIDSSPPILFVRGNPELLSRPQLAMVGSRNPSAQGRQIAYQFARQLASDSLCITSGLALGIDAACHSGALDGQGPTLAVLGTGADRIYPARHQALAQQIVSNAGALVSEFPVGTQPSPGQFPRRNRIISGLSLGTLVVEAGVESGSLITARLATEQGREVFAIPGSINNPMSKGCHRLIKDGAKLVESIEDILSEFPSGRLTPAAEFITAALDLDDQTRHLLVMLDQGPASIDTLVGQSKLPPDTISSILVVLELHNLVSSSGGLYCRV